VPNGSSSTPSPRRRTLAAIVLGFASIFLRVDPRKDARPAVVQEVPPGAVDPPISIPPEAPTGA
jgi:hypothetical protein